MLHVGKSIARTVQSLQNFEILRKKWHEERERRRFDEDYTELQSIYRCVALPLSLLSPPLSLYLSLALTHHRILLLHRRNFLRVIRAEEAGHHDESFDRNDFRDEEREDRREDP